MRLHGDGVHDIALWVDDARDAYEKATRARRRLGVCASRPQTTQTGRSSTAGIKIYGDTIHSLVERKNYRGAFMPGFQPRTPRYQARARWRS